MKIEKIDHIAINTKNIPESIDFYCGVLGFTEQNTVDMTECKLTYIELPGRARIELFDYEGKNPHIKHGDEETGLRHIAFSVDNIEGWEQKLRDGGVEITLPLTELPQLGVRVILFLEPNGVTVEFSEML